jgi:hypothetical protein
VAAAEAEAAEAEAAEAEAADALEAAQDAEAVAEAVAEVAVCRGALAASARRGNLYPAPRFC